MLPSSTYFNIKSLIAEEGDTYVYIYIYIYTYNIANVEGHTF